MILFLVIAAAALAVAGLALSAKRTLGRLKAAEERNAELRSGVADAAARLEAAAGKFAPETPVAPVMERVVFEDREGGLWLSYDDYRALERNVIAMREWAAKLEAIIDFYKEAGSWR
jgi:hypothetical protein